jgi:PAS domain-containing protein
MDARCDAVTVAQVVVETMVGHLGGVAARVWAFERPGAPAALQAWAGLPPEIDGATTAGDAPARYGAGLDAAFQGHAAQVVADAAVGSFGAPAWTREHGVRGYVIAPLTFADEVVGACAFFSREPLASELALVIAAFAHHTGVALHDVREQRRARTTIEALAFEAHARAGEFEAIVSNMPDAVFVAHGGAITFANATAARMLGQDDPRSLQVPLEAFVRLANVREPDGTPVAMEGLTLNRVLRGEVITGREQRMTNAKTHRDLWVQIAGAPLRDPRGEIQGGVIVATEITRLKEYEHSKDEWLAIAAHELRTPLTPITVHLQMAQRRLQMGRPVDPAVLDKALEQVKRLARLVNGLLDVTRLQAGQLDLLLEDVDVAELVESLVDRARPAAPEHTLIVEVQGRGRAIVRGDRMRLGEVIAALLERAADAVRRARARALDRGQGRRTPRRADRARERAGARQYVHRGAAPVGRACGDGRGPPGADPGRGRRPGGARRGACAAGRRRLRRRGGAIGPRRARRGACPPAVGHAAGPPDARHGRLGGAAALRRGSGVGVDPDRGDVRRP